MSSSGRKRSNSGSSKEIPIVDLEQETSAPEYTARSKENGSESQRSIVTASENEGDGEGYAKGPTPKKRPSRRVEPQKERENPQIGPLSEMSPSSRIDSFMRQLEREWKSV